MEKNSYPISLSTTLKNMLNEPKKVYNQESSESPNLIRLNPLRKIVPKNKIQVQTSSFLKPQSNNSDLQEMDNDVNSNKQSIINNGWCAELNYES